MALRNGEAPAVTRYVVLWSEKGDGDWIQIAGLRDTRSAISAIRDYLENGNTEITSGYFVAVPARSWKPVTVKVETKTELKFS